MPSFSPTGSSGRHNARLKAPSKAKDVQGTLRRLLGYLGGQWGIIAIVLAASLISTVITVVGTRLNGVAVDRYILVGRSAGLGAALSDHARHLRGQYRRHLRAEYPHDRCGAAHLSHLAQ